MSLLQIGPEVTLREDVAHIYHKYQERIPCGSLPLLPLPGGENVFYVYEWFTKDTEKVFYVGKGAERRYRHILYDMKRSRGAKYKELQDAYGIDFRFLAKDLTSFEAELYEMCIILQRTDEGEVLLQSANNPGYSNWMLQREAMRLRCSSRSFQPEIVVSPYHQRYFNITPPDYDLVSPAQIRVAFHAAFSSPSPATLTEMDRVREVIKSANGQVFSTVGKRTQTIVEFDNMDYEDFIKFKSRGFRVCHAFDIMSALTI